MAGEPADRGVQERYRAMAALLSDAVQRYGIEPAKVEEKAALEGRRAAEQVSLDGTQVSWTVFEDSWAKGKMETPGIQLYDYVLMLHLAVPGGRGAEALPQIRDYWLSRGLKVEPEADLSAGKVVAYPGAGEWTLSAGIVEPATVSIRVASGPVPTTSSPLGSDEES